MSGFRDFLRSLAPAWLLEKYRSGKKNEVRRQLEEQRSKGQVWTKQDLIDQLIGIGIQEGDTLLVHSSLSKMGYVEGGAQTVIDALLEVLGKTGNLLMPTSPNAGYQLDYIRSLDVFDVNETPSALGAITETFRKMPGTQRSASPTEPVSAFGPNANELTAGHLGKITPYTADSPFYKVAEKSGKILYIGVTLANAGTSLHLLEDAVDEFKFPVYYPELFSAKVRTAEGTVHEAQTRVHNPEWSAKRRCDELIPLFETAGVLRQVQIGSASTLFVDAKGMFVYTIKSYEERGVTMYTPQGS